MIDKDLENFLLGILNEELSKNFVSKELLEWLPSISENHLQLIYKTAKNIVTKGKAEKIEKLLEENKDKEHLPLVAVSSKIKLNLINLTKYYYKPAQINKEVINYPCKLDNNGKSKLLTAEDYKSLKEEFAKEFQELTIKDFNLLFLLAEKYTSFIPLLRVSENNNKTEKELEEFEAVSLFDYLKLLIAVASCLYLYLKEKNALEDENQIKNITDLRYLLIAGDFSGVQEFIFTISSKGALKTLRARSFFIELLTEHVIYEILKIFGLSQANVIFRGGAKFSLLLPNINNVSSKLENIKKQINKWLFYEQSIRLYLVLEKIELCGNIIMGGKEEECRKRKCIAWCKGLPPSEVIFGAKKEALPFKIQKAKYQKFKDNELFEILKPKDSPQVEGFFNGSYQAKTCIRCESNKERVTLKLKNQLNVTDVIYGCVDCLGENQNQAKNKGIMEHGGECAVCHKPGFVIKFPPPAENVYGCIFCDSLYHLGEHLPEAQYIIQAKEAIPSKGIIRIQNVWYHVEKDIEELNKYQSKAEAIWLINQWQIQEYTHIKEKFSNVQLNQFLVAQHYQPKEDEEGRRANFEYIANQAIGIKQLGVLRADIDNLGDLFTATIKNLGFMQYATFSRQLNLFFKFYLDTLLEGKSLNGIKEDLTGKQEERNIVVIYSSGDDLFLVGAWSDIIEFTYELRRAFKKFTSNNPDINLSAGVVVCKPKLPIHHMADLAYAGEKKAKKMAGKDAVALFYPAGFVFNKDQRLYEATKWGSFNGLGKFEDFSAEDILKLLKQIIENFGKKEKEHIKLEELPRSFIYNMFDVVDVMKQENKFYLHLPKLAYALSRTEASIAEDKKDSWIKLRNKFYSINTMRYLQPVLIWLDLLVRDKAK